MKRIVITRKIFAGAFFLFILLCIQSQSHAADSSPAKEATPQKKLQSLKSKETAIKPDQPAIKQTTTWIGVIALIPVNSEVDRLSFREIATKRVYDSTKSSIEITSIIRDEDGTQQEEEDIFYLDESKKQASSKKSVDGNRVLIFPYPGAIQTLERYFFRMPASKGVFVGKEQNNSKGGRIGTGVILNKNSQTEFNVTYSLQKASEAEFLSFRKEKPSEMQMFQAIKNSEAYQTVPQRLRPIRGTCLYRSHQQDRDYDFLRLHFLPLTGTLIYERFRLNEEASPLIFQRVSFSNVFRLQGSDQYSTGIIDLDISNPAKKISWKAAFQGKRASESRKESITMDSSTCIEEINSQGEQNLARSRRGLRLPTDAEVSLPTILSFLRTRSIKAFDEKQKLPGSNSFYCSAKVSENEGYGKNRHFVARAVTVPSEKKIYFLYLNFNRSIMTSFLQQGQTNVYFNAFGSRSDGFSTLRLLSQPLDGQTKSFEASFLVVDRMRNVIERRLRINSDSCTWEGSTASASFQSFKVSGKVTAAAFYQTLSDILAESFELSEDTKETVANAASLAP